MKTTASRNCEECGERRRFFWHCHDGCGNRNHVATCLRCGVLNLLSWKPILACFVCLLFLSTLSLAQQSAQNDSATLRLVAACNRGVYDACDLVGGHWYYRVGTVWTRDDGVVGKPPVVPVVSCPVQQSFKEPSRYDLSFLKDARTYIGVGFSFGVTGYDISTSHGFESTRFYRGSDGQLNRGKYLGVTALTNVALLPLDLQRDHRWRWVSLGLRVGLAGWRMKAALRNGGQ